MWFFYGFPLPCLPYLSDAIFICAHTSSPLTRPLSLLIPTSLLCLLETMRFTLPAVSSYNMLSCLLPGV